MKCRKCKVELTENNWSASRKKRQDYICSGCKTSEMKALRELKVEQEEWQQQKDRKDNGQCLMCGCEYSEDAFYPSNKSRCKKCCSTHNSSFYEIEQKLWYGARCRARKFNREFDIEVTDIVIPDKCPVLGLPMISTKGTTGDTSPTLDRIDSSKGYTKGNIAVISWRANRLKSNGTLEDFEKIVAWLKG